MMASDPYQYRPLVGANSTRILSLLPNPSNSSEIEVQLSEIDLGSPPSYEALSYAWGDPKTKTTIKCEGMHLHVTPNCASALKHLRTTKETRILWVDAICIDQSSLHERNVQVKRMGDIYSKASRVVIWLGTIEPKYSFDILAFSILSTFEPFIKSGEEEQKSWAKGVYGSFKGEYHLAGVSICLF